MDNGKTNLPAVRDPERAIDLVQKHKGLKDLVFVAEEDLRTQTMFLPEVVVIHSTPDDFHNIQGNFMPKGYQTDRIGEAAGIVYLEKNCGTRTEKVDGETAYVGFAQGKKRMPDGTWRTSSICEYEFNPAKRAEEDILRDTKRKYNTEKDKKLLLLNYKKFGRQRASTGARLRVVRELTGMPISFKPDQIKRAMVFSRVAVNTDLLLADPEMREAAIKIALGASKEIYGPPKESHKALSENYTVDNGNEPAQIEEQPKEETEIPWETETEEEKQNREILEDLQIRRKKYDERLPKNAKEVIDKELAQEKPDMNTISGLIDKFDAWENELKARGAVK